MDALDLLAYLILIATVIFALVPMLGAGFSGPFSNYIEDLKIGLAVIFSMAVVSIVLFSIAWAYVRVFG